MKQIVEETKANGTKQYRVITNNHIFGLFKDKWRTDTYKAVYPGCTMTFDAVFKTLEEAETHVYGKPKSEEIVKRRVIEPKSAVVEA